MRFPLALLAFLLGCTAHRPVHVMPPDLKSPPPATLIAGVDVFSGFDDFLLRDVDVLLVGGRIRAIVPHGNHDLDGRVVLVDGRGKVLLPGLVDMHVLVGGEGDGADNPRLELERLLSQGVTTAVVVGHETDVEALQRQVAAGKVAGPRLFRSTRPIRGVGPVPALYELASVQRAENPLDAARAARTDLERYRSDFVRMDWSESLSPEAMRAVVAEARAFQKPVFAMASSADGAVVTAEAGVSLLLLPPWIDRLSKEQAHRISLSGVPVVIPTGVCSGAAEPGSCSSNLQENVRSLLDADVPVLGGSGAGIGAVGPAPSMQRGLEEMVALGMRPAEALASATSLPVRLLDPKASFGVVTPGAYADLILVEGNPLEDITSLRNIVAIWQGGHLLERASQAPDR